MSIFSKVPVERLPRNTFNLSHEKKLSCSMGKLIPIFLQDLVPGDVFRNTSEIFLRFAPLISPVMHRVNVYTHFFAVPNRLLMNHKCWENFITGNDPDQTLPIMDIGQIISRKLQTFGSDLQGAKDFVNKYFANGSLCDYLGLPTLPKFYGNKTIGSNIVDGDLHLTVNMMPFLAYAIIWNEYYRDQNLQDELRVDYWAEDFGDDEWLKILELQVRNWEKDYFTSAMPWAQKGDAVKIPGTDGSGIGRYAPIVYHAVSDAGPAWGDGHTMMMSRGPALRPVTNTSVYDGSGIDGSILGGTDGIPPGQLGARRVGASVPDGDGANGNGLLGPVDINPNGNLWADLHATADEPYQDLNNWPPDGTNGNIQTGNTINDLRTAFQLQRWFEKNARAGTRYIEQIWAHFRTNTPDSRLQRPEYIGGGMSPVVISEVLQTSETSNSPQANMAGHGLSASANNSFKYKALEHMYIIGIMSVMPRSAYQQGVPRHYLRTSKFDYYWKEFSNIGEQPVYQQELLHLFKNSNNAMITNNKTFGYQSRYAEYKYVPSSVHGDMRDDLNFWHLGRIFKGESLGFNNVDPDDNAPDAQSSLPHLSSDFIKCQPSKRIFAVDDQDVDDLWVEVYNNCRAVRPMPRFSVPGFSDH